MNTNTDYSVRNESFDIENQNKKMEQKPETLAVKVKTFFNEMFQSPAAKEAVGFVGRLAACIGARYFCAKVLPKYKDVQLPGNLPAAFVGNSLITQFVKEADQRLPKSSPISNEVMQGVYDYQQKALAEQLVPQAN